MALVSAWHGRGAESATQHAALSKAYRGVTDGRCEKVMEIERQKKGGQRECTQSPMGVDGILAVKKHRRAMTPVLTELDGVAVGITATPGVGELLATTHHQTESTKSDQDRAGWLGHDCDIFHGDCIHGDPSPAIGEGIDEIDLIRFISGIS